MLQPGVIKESPLFYDPWLQLYGHLINILENSVQQQNTSETPSSNLLSNSKVNILLWGCESWALTAELERKLKVSLPQQISKENGRNYNKSRPHI